MGETHFGGEMKICLHQWLRPTGPKVEVEGVGDCKVCIPHENNKSCRCYCEISAPQKFEVKERE
jgi:hypothetical protein